MTDKPQDIRLDKWLWAARFFKTRSLAAAAVSGGKIHVNGARSKPARALHPGDTLDIRRGTETLTVTVLELSGRRGPAKEAQLLYEESADSITRRRIQQEQRRLESQGAPHPAGRPSKRDRRRILAWKGRQQDS